MHAPAPTVGIGKGPPFRATSGLSVCLRSRRQSARCEAEAKKEVREAGELLCKLGRLCRCLAGGRVAGTALRCQCQSAASLPVGAQAARFRCSQLFRPRKHTQKRPVPPPQSARSLSFPSLHLPLHNIRLSRHSGAGPGFSCHENKHTGSTA
jgi:hypothetical protein